MQITFVTDVGESYALEIDPNMEMENIMALLEAECSIPVSEQSISYEGRDLDDPKKTVAQCGVREGAMILLRRKVVVAGRSTEQDAEMMRLQILGDPGLMAQLRATQPELAEAATNDPARFASLLRQLRAMQDQAEAQKQRQTDLLNADPYDLAAQQRIEEAIRQEAVMENLNHALEYSPEFFGRVHMLYIPLEVNGVEVKAFVDSGAQQTIMSPGCAEHCGIMRLIDTRFSGIAKGVGTAKILGRVHSAQLKIADLHLPCAFTIMEGRDVDLLFGLDMLKAHQACIDLEQNVLRIKGRTVAFLPEHELPDNARNEHIPDEQNNATSTPSATNPTPPRFPGAGSTLGGTSSSAPRTPSTGATPGRTQTSSRQQSNQSRYPEKDIQLIMDMGVSREAAIRTLDAAGGNVDLAASLLF
ncbi:DNA damage-inducible protein 1 [Serendipita sp. 396]|nr:DNA damage-inducible protein 1 [Serendipita sp. 396]KAG8786920.1 DNA damage-inducible protein 1 [Serendipita sp. 397]KAG8824524.1 DNA damage-inducible protein 1 [Serendipita sp. 401]KAG8858068.1 DNA damage-inducible protein 1 [Serendipita sp. 411]KAG8871638.1 DNA damage-inducible protein 1 [Serendipita sp. 405]KAG9055282.1 DNA damage-inducible protein 1 [Serendipita sp. 407]